MKQKKDPRGRKPVADKIQRVDLFLRESTIKTFGGKDSIQTYCYLHIDKKIKQVSKRINH